MALPAGFLIIDKPPGETSFAMVSLVRRLAGIRRVGHAGTLDPMATGVLPIALGHATRFIEYMDDAPKRYRARVSFGTATDTYDAAGVVTETGDSSFVTDRTLRTALTGFVGEIRQAPPAYSALKLAGRPLYRYAREGAAIAPAPRTVMIFELQLLSFDGGTAELEVCCGKGTYIRSLAHDLGRALGCPAHLSGLVRGASGGFTLDDALTVAELERRHAAGELGDAVLAVDRAVERRPAVILAAAHRSDVLAGRDVYINAERAPRICRAYGVEGDFLGVLEAVAEGGWHPRKVLA